MLPCKSHCFRQLRGNILYYCSTETDSVYQAEDSLRELSCHQRCCRVVSERVKSKRHTSSPVLRLSTLLITMLVDVILNSQFRCTNTVNPTSLLPPSSRPDTLKNVLPMTHPHSTLCPTVELQHTSNGSYTMCLICRKIKLLYILQTLKQNAKINCLSVCVFL